MTLCVAAVALRLLYTWNSAYDERGHDAPGHLDYIVYVAANFSLPPPADGFEFYQPPLYYIFAAPAVWIANIIHASEQLRNILIQIFSLICSLLTFWIAMKIGKKLLTDKKNILPLHLYAVLLGTTPAFLFFAARVNNDVLYQVWAFLAFLLMLMWWERPNTTTWLSICAVLGLGLLTKTNMALLVLPCFICLFAKKKMGWMVKIAQAFAGLAVILLIAGWFHIPRVLDDDAKTAVVGNYAELTNFVENNVGNYLTFNPIAMVQYPFNDPYNDEARRQEFWEYFFRSALYGEFHFGNDRMLLALVMLLSSLLMIPFAAINLFRDIRRNTYASLPVWCTFLTILLGAAAFRFVFPYSSSQDFRYSVLLLPLFAYYAVRDTGFARQFFHRTQVILTAVFGVAATGFLLTL